MAGRSGVDWLLDEYLIVGDLWLRKGRSVGTTDPEVKEIAALLDRSPGSISYRIGNFAGTDNPGHGLKPLTGEALSMWEDLRDDTERFNRALIQARRRVSLVVNGSTRTEGAHHGLASLVSVERPGVEPVVVSTKEEVKAAEQKEAVLREDFRQWRDQKGERIRGIEILAEKAKLRVDLYDTVANVLIEVKAKASRNHLRLAVGQLYDYRRYLPFDVDLAVLVPEQPSEDLMGLLLVANVGAIWPEGRGFSDSANGHYLRSI